jgi:hypothetical protein
MHKEPKKSYGTSLPAHQMVGGYHGCHNDRNRQPQNTAHAGYKAEHRMHAEAVHVNVSYNSVTNKIG